MIEPTIKQLLVLTLIADGVIGYALFKIWLNQKICMADHVVLARMLKRILKHLGLSEEMPG